MVSTLLTPGASLHNQKAAQQLQQMTPSKARRDGFFFCKACIISSLGSHTDLQESVENHLDGLCLKPEHRKA